jgi:hypothetical protein
MAIPPIFGIWALLDFWLSESDRNESQESKDRDQASNDCR